MMSAAESTAQHRTSQTAPNEQWAESDKDYLITKTIKKELSLLLV